MNQILIAVDESEGGHAAVESGLELARETGARATFVTVRHAPSKVLGAPFDSKAVGTSLKEARAVVEFALERAAEWNVEADAEILEGDPAAEIVSLADNRGVDLIVIGSRGLGALAGAILGSVSRSVVQHAGAPVVVAKTPARRPAVVAE